MCHKTKSNQTNPFTKPFGIVLSAPIKIGVTVALMFHYLF